MSATRDQIRKAIDDAHLFHCVTKDSFNEMSDRLAEELERLFVPVPTETYHTYRDCDANHLTRTLDKTKLTEEVVAVIPGLYGDLDNKTWKRTDGFRIVLKCAECRHDWESGWGMGAPTRTCKKCGKFEND
jgi:hypothetical protein